MKRSSDGAAADPTHPSLAFHREVLIVQQWTAIRRDFLATLQQHSGVLGWHEPKKLWRHSQEALGKWILSQVARVAQPQSERELFFFPTKDMVQQQQQQQAPHTASASPLTSSSSSSTTTTTTSLHGTFINGKTYDEQLIRDLSLKCAASTDVAIVPKVEQLVRDFDLAARCDAAAKAVADGMQHITPHNALRPRLRRVEEDDETSRTPSQKRIAGPIAEFTVEWPARWARSQTRDCPPVSLPWAAYEKLRRCYAKFGEASDTATYGVSQEAAGGWFLRRAAVVALRYEGGLATGSLQLCADTRLKQHLHAAGYHVMDLCASPINAYMGVPRVSAFGDPHSTEGGSDGDDTEVPNSFCSAFYDTDVFFGSLGSAMHVQPQVIARSATVNEGGRPLLLTLDVPYDEDLCEMLFQKLVRDMREAEPSPVITADIVAVDYVLVIPLWWYVPMQIRKQLFWDGDQPAEQGKAGGTAASKPTAAPAHGDAVEPLVAGGSTEKELLQRLIQERTATLREGYRVPYQWPETLAAAAGDARGATREEPPSSSPSASPPSRRPPWVVFDGEFVGNSYAYFCTNTNRWLTGVTGTEVIALAQPRPSAQGGATLKDALRAFYGRV